MLIRNMGLFWNAERVFWGSRGPGKKGSLPGKLSTGKKQGTVEFWEQRGIYALYGDYHLVYVGQTAGQNLGKRLRDHRSDDLAERWDRLSWFGVRYVRRNNTLSKMPTTLNEKTTGVLNHIESILTTVAEPPLNRQRGRWKDIKQYLQEPSEQEPGGHGV